MASAQRTIAVTKLGESWSWSVRDRYGDRITGGPAADEAEAVRLALQGRNAEDTVESPSAS